MNALELLADLKHRGVQLKSEGERLTYTAPGGVLQPADFEQLRTHKAELLKVLNHDNRRASANQDVYQAERKAEDQGRVAHVRRAVRDNDRRDDSAATGVQAGADASPTKQLDDPTEPCKACGSGQYWQVPGEPWHCWQCEPNKPLLATTLTLACHPPLAPPTGAQAYSDAVLEAVCKNLNITPAQLREELADDDLSELSPKALRQVARTLADARPPQNEAIDRLRQDPELERAFVTTSDDPKFIYLAVAIRGQATGRLRIPRDKYDGLKALAWIEQHASKPKP